MCYVVLLVRQLSKFQEAADTGSLDFARQAYVTVFSSSILQ